MNPPVRTDEFPTSASPCGEFIKALWGIHQVLRNVNSGKVMMVGTFTEFATTFPEFGVHSPSWCTFPEFENV